jgi:amidohydrolase
MIEQVFGILEDRRRDLVELRRDLHVHPELGFEEVRTSGIVAERLTRAGLQVRTGVARTGVVGVLKGGKAGRTVMVRADIDALPILEAENRPYRSQTAGVMHACGHDGHTAIAVVLAETLSELRSELPGSLVFAFQPAEEITAGALPMIEAGVMDSPKVDAVVGLHLWNDLPAGVVGVRAGPIFAAMDRIHLTIEGKGGHGGIPHQAADPIVASAHVVTALQTIVSRETSPLDAAVVTLGTISGGTAFNIIPDRVELQGTVRTFTEEVRERTMRRISEIATGTAAALRCRATVNSQFGCPPVRNDVAVTDLVRRVAVDAVGASRVVEMEPTTGADDMAYFLERAPGCYFLVGSANRERGLDGRHHTAQFDFDETALTVAARVLGGAALRLLGGVA